MERVTSKYDEKFHIINKIQYSFRKKKQQINHNQIQVLPPITNGITTVPQSIPIEIYKKFQSTKNPWNKKMRQQLDTIFNKSSLSQEDSISKIIFTSPMSNRANLNKTSFRLSVYKTIDPTHHIKGINSHSLQKKRTISNLQKSLEFLLTPIKPKNVKVDKIDNKQFNTSQRYNQFTDKDLCYSNILNSNPEKVLEKRKKVEKRNKVGKRSQGQVGTRFSPWKNQETIEDLLS